MFWGTGHYDFAESECVGNQASSSSSSKQDGEKTKKRFDLTFRIIVSNVKNAVKLSQWYKTSEKALSFSDNERLTPGRNNSKLYPGDIHVQFSEIPVPNSNPQVLHAPQHQESYTICESNTRLIFHTHWQHNDYYTDVVRPRRRNEFKVANLMPENQVSITEEKSRVCLPQTHQM